GKTITALALNGLHGSRSTTLIVFPFAVLASLRGTSTVCLPLTLYQATCAGGFKTAKSAFVSLGSSMLFSITSSNPPTMLNSTSWNLALFEFPRKKRPIPIGGNGHFAVVREDFSIGGIHTSHEKLRSFGPVPREMLGSLNASWSASSRVT